VQNFVKADQKRATKCLANRMAQDHTEAAVQY